MSFSGDYAKKRKRTKNYLYEKNLNLGPTDKNKWNKSFWKYPTLMFISTNNYKIGYF